MNRDSDAEPPAWVECPPSEEMVRWIAKLLETMGATILLGPERENLCRRARRDEMTAFSGRKWVIESQGLPNLIHELVHALFLGHLDDDHGFDYGLIPLDLARRDHRRWLWEELAACAISSAYGSRHVAEPALFARDWFEEQVEIQGVFHGLEDDLAGFRRLMDEQLRDLDRLAELRATQAAGYEAVEAALMRVGAPAELARVSCRLDAAELWAEYRRRWEHQVVRR